MSIRFGLTLALLWSDLCCEAIVVVELPLFLNILTLNRGIYAWVNLNELGHLFTSILETH